MSSLNISDRLWDVTVSFSGTSGFHATDEAFQTFLRTLLAWRSAVPVMGLRVVQVGAPIDRLWSFDFEVQDGRDYSIGMLIPVAGPSKIRPKTEEFWLRSEITAIFPVAAQVIALIQARNVTAIAVDWK